MIIQARHQVAAACAAELQSRGRAMWRKRLQSCGRVMWRRTSVLRCLHSADATLHTHRSDQLCFSIFEAVIHFLPSFSETAPVTVALASFEHWWPAFSAASFFTT